MSENYEEEFNSFKKNFASKENGDSKNMGHFKGDKVKSTYSGYSKVEEPDSIKKKDPEIGIRNALMFIATVVCFAILKITSGFIIPFVLAFFLFIIFNPLIDKLNSFHVPNFLSSIIAVLLMMAVIVAAFFFVTKSLQSLITTLPNITKRITEIDSVFSAFLIRHIDKLPQSFDALTSFDINWTKLTTDTAKQLTSGTLSTVKSLILVLLYVIFLLLEKNTIVPKIAFVTRKKNSDSTLVIFERITKQISKYIGLKTLISLITGVLIYFGCRMAKLPLAPVIGILTFIMNFIPTLGSIIVTIFTILFAIVQLYPSWHVIILLGLWSIVVQTIFGSFIDPRLQGDQLNLSPFLILFSLALWGYIWGIIGMFLAVPIMSILQIVFANMKGTMPIAILMSNGKISRKFKKKKETNNKDKKAKERKDSFYDSVILPKTDKDKKSNKDKK